MFAQDCGKLRCTTVVPYCLQHQSGLPQNMCKVCAWRQVRRRPRERKCYSLYGLFSRRPPKGTLEQPNTGNVGNIINAKRVDRADISYELAREAPASAKKLLAAAKSDVMASPKVLVRDISRDGIGLNGINRQGMRRTSSVQVILPGSQTANVRICQICWFDARSAGLKSIDVVAGNIAAWMPGSHPRGSQKHRANC
jgi:hypothetical protein